MASGSIEKRGKSSWRLVVEVGDSGVRDKEYKTIKVDDPALLRTTKNSRTISMINSINSKEKSNPAHT